MNNASINELLATSAVEMVENCRRSQADVCPALDNVRAATKDLNQPEYLEFINALNHFMACPVTEEGTCSANDLVQDLFSRLVPAT